MKICFVVFYFEIQEFLFSILKRRNKQTNENTQNTQTHTCTTQNGNG